MSGECNICGTWGCVEANHWEYALRKVRELEPYWTRHMDAMTKEGLTRKDHIAAELAWRDLQIERLRDRNEALSFLAANHETALEHYKRLATQRGARMQTLRKWLCLEMVVSSEDTYDSLDEAWRDYTLMWPEAADWFGPDGVPK